MIQALSDALAERGYDTLTPVQEAVTAEGLEASDLLVSAQTGSGKTVGFGLAIAPTILGEGGAFGPAAAPLALVVAPTRELAFQVKRELDWLYAGAGARIASCVGGMDMRDERRTLERGAHVVVGTPGRLRDHIQRGSLDLGDVRAVVLDEADEMLDLGFREDLEFMLDAAPEGRRTLMFSATVPPMIVTLAKRYQRDAVRVTTLSERSQHTDIAYQALRVSQQDAETAIINVLRFHEAQNAIVFANTRAAVNRLTARFANRGFSVVSLSGELSQAERTHALQAMRDGRARVCVATDVAARGIDLPNLELVVHAELPSNAETLLHRSGRTGRAGRKGTSALIVPPKAAKKAERLLKTARVTAEWMAAPGADEILRRDEERLLADPVWDEAPGGDEAAFAARLLAEKSPEQIAAAYLRLYRQSHSAPEDLADPEMRPAPKERAPFGPSVWFALSVGRAERAEPRWLLPLLCRAGDLTPDAIGAIRVQGAETYVQIAEGRAAGFEAALGAGGQLEEGVNARRMEGEPDLGPASRGGPPRRPGGKPPHRGDRPAPQGAAPEGDRPRGKGPGKGRPGRANDAEADRDGATRPYKPRGPKSGGPKHAGPKVGGPKAGGKPGRDGGPKRGPGGPRRPKG
ncbi:DEAD/DEAH box helicase [Wenxinia saemankumensis]|uniref:ATP-dependent RNA helicase DeaD n=1 Tax=Wenxinia saemankumensis TaxID=1447782 RepID=A0A1M6AUV3_9RHOB|nr:DEAD/DEAH box helicase [Wenxinia saemankumensis]SHI40255.1 ATP-dependent RNA helicase DeaD [Wenxinia saemankumensis]